MSPAPRVWLVRACAQAVALALLGAIAVAVGGSTAAPECAPCAADAPRCPLVP